MRFSKLFIAIACVLLVLVGAALGYSVKMFRQVGDMERELKLIDYDLRGLEYRIFLLESSQLQMEPPGNSNISSHGLGSAGRKGQLWSLPVGKPSGRKEVILWEAFTKEVKPIG
ncbi:MAG: hypothetical protein KAV87_32020 [Desulfobacteraceae bacterium]|nr:hypothetical protein [Desulfobacteraceae bacterium]